MHRAVNAPLKRGQMKTERMPKDASHSDITKALPFLGRLNVGGWRDRTKRYAFSKKMQKYGQMRAKIKR